MMGVTVRRRQANRGAVLNRGTGRMGSVGGPPPLRGALRMRLITAAAGALVRVRAPPNGVSAPNARISRCPGTVRAATSSPPEAATAPGTESGQAAHVECLREPRRHDASEGDRAPAADRSRAMR